jgi:hypothetical protein
MSAKVTYNNKRLLPTPFPSISKSIERYENGDIRNILYSISLSGYILADKGSPKTTGAYGDFDGNECENIAPTAWTSAITEKWCIISDLFAVDYKELCMSSGADLHEITAYPRLISMDLDTSAENPRYAQYTINLEADTIYCDGTEVNNRADGFEHIKSYDESWEFSYDRLNIDEDLGDNRVFSVSRTISAQGLPQITAGVVTKTAYQSAKEFVCSRLTDGSGVQLPSNCVGFSEMIDTNIQRNYSNTHSVNIYTGDYTVSENWMYSEKDYLDVYTISHAKSLTESCDTVSIQGNFTGFDKRVGGSVTVSAFNVAKSGYDELGESGIRARVESIVGFTVDPIPESSTISYNKFGGVVDYDFTFKQRPNRYVTEAKSEIISISNNWEEDVVNTVLILGKGEVVRKNNTTGFRAYSTSLNVNLVFPCSVLTSGEASEEHSNLVSLTEIPPYGPRFNPVIAGKLQTLINTYNPANITIGEGEDEESVFSNVSVESQNETWDRNSGSYDYSVTWKFNLAGICSA